MDFHVEYYGSQEIKNFEACRTLLDFDGGDKPFRERIMELQSVMKELPGEEISIDHVLGGGMYARTMHAKAGTLLIGKIYKKEQIIVMSSGVHEFRSETLGGLLDVPCVFKSPAGSKRVGYCHTDVVWTCIVKTDATTIEEAEKDIYADSYEELDRFMLGDTLESAGG
jgi:hypothetical protein